MNEVIIFTHNADDSTDMVRIPVEHTGCGASGCGDRSRAWESFNIRAAVVQGGVDVSYEIRMDEATARRVAEQLAVYLKGRTD